MACHDNNIIVVTPFQGYIPPIQSSSFNSLCSKGCKVSFRVIFQPPDRQEVEQRLTLVFYQGERLPFLY